MTLSVTNTTVAGANDDTRTAARRTGGTTRDNGPSQNGPTVAVAQTHEIDRTLAYLHALRPRNRLTATRRHITP